MNIKQRLQLRQAIREVQARMGVIMTRDQRRAVIKKLIQEWNKNEKKPIRPDPQRN